MKAMKRLAVVFTLAATALLFTGCEVWLFLADGGGGGVSGIEVYADIRGVANVTAPDSLRTSVFKLSGATYIFEAEYAAPDGAEVLETRFTNLSTGTYKVIVYYDSNNDDSPQYNQETGYTTGPISYSSGGYAQVVVDSGDWTTVQNPN